MLRFSAPILTGIHFKHTLLSDSVPLFPAPFLQEGGKEKCKPMRGVGRTVLPNNSGNSLECMTLKILNFHLLFSFSTSLLPLCYHLLLSPPPPPPPPPLLFRWMIWIHTRLKNIRSLLLLSPVMNDRNETRVMRRKARIKRRHLCVVMS